MREVDNKKGELDNRMKVVEKVRKGKDTRREGK